MLTLPLRIEYARQPVGQALAWLMPGDDAAAWLRELVTAGVAANSTELFVVSRATAGLQLGVLVVPGKDAAIAPPQWQPYTRLAGRLYLPVNAVLAPAIEESELAALLAGGDCTYLFHPAVGLVAFDSARVVRPSDLLVAQPQTAVDWNRARPGIGFVKRLTAVEPEQTFDLSALLEKARDDIGSEPIDPETLPKSPLEPDERMISSFCWAEKPPWQHSWSSLQNSRRAPPAIRPGSTRSKTGPTRSGKPAPRVSTPFEIARSCGCCNCSRKIRTRGCDMPCRWPAIRIAAETLPAGGLASGM